MKKELFAHKKLVCIPATDECWISQLNNPDVKFEEFIGFAGNTQHYAVFSIPNEMTKNEFHEAINMECNSFVLCKNGVKNW